MNKLTLFTCMLFAVCTRAQSPAILWQNTIGGSGTDHLRSMQPTADGGYILGGWSNSDSSGDKTENRIGMSDYWLVKIDSAGTVQWQITIGGSDVDNLYTLQQTTDGGF